MPATHLKISTCPICFTSFETTRHVALPCKCVCCQSCLNEWLSLKIKEPSFILTKNIPCFTNNCPGSFQIHSIFYQLPKLLRENINQELLNFYLVKTSDVRKCPNAYCSYAGTIDVDAKCSQQLQCKACHVTWRDPINFTKTDRILAILKGTATQKNEAFSSLWKALWAKKCPSCRVPIQKAGGCYHMSCSQCQFTFCWTCNGQHSELKHIFNFLLFAFPTSLVIMMTLYWVYQVLMVNSIVNTAVDPIVRFGKYALLFWPYCWAEIKFLFNILCNSILTNVIFILAFCIYERLKKGTLNAQLYPLELLAIIFGILGVSYYFELYQKMLIIGLIETPFILVALYLERQPKKRLKNSHRINRRIGFQTLQEDVEKKLKQKRMQWVEVAKAVLAES